MINKNDYLWIDFADRYRSLASHAVDFIPRDFMQYTIVLDDGSELIYDTEYKVVRNILKDNDCMDDVLMRREFAWRLKKQMHRAEIRQEELSERAGVSQASISKYICGESAPSIIVAKRIALVLGCSVSDLMC